MNGFTKLDPIPSNSSWESFSQNPKYQSYGGFRQDVKCSSKNLASGCHECLYTNSMAIHPEVVMNSSYGPKEDLLTDSAIPSPPLLLRLKWKARSLQKVRIRKKERQKDKQTNQWKTSPPDSLSVWAPPPETCPPHPPHSTLSPGRSRPSPDGTAVPLACSHLDKIYNNIKNIVIPDCKHVFFILKSLFSGLVFIYPYINQLNVFFPKQCNSVQVYT